MIGDLRRAFSLVSDATRARWAMLVPLAVVAALAEAGGAVAVFGLLRVLTAPADVARIPVASEIYRRLPRHDAPVVIITFSVLLILLFVVRNIVLVGTSYVRERVVHRSILEIARGLMHAYLHAPYLLLLRRNSATIMQRVQRSSEVVATLVLASVINLATEALVVIALVGLLVSSAPAVTIVAVAATLVLLLLPAAFTGRVFRRFGSTERRLDGDAVQELQQAFGAVKDIRLRGHESAFLERYARLRAQLCRVQRRRNTLSEVLRLSVETVFAIVLAVVVILLIGAGRSGSETLSLLGLYAYAGFRLVPSANRMSLNLNHVRNGRPFVVDLWDDLQEIQHRDEVSCRELPRTPVEFNQAITLDGVCFSYGDGRPGALAGVNLTIRRGESIGIVGTTGAGKSTLVDVVLGLLTPTAGRVLVDGRDIHASLHSWQSRIGYVPQTVSVLDDTLRANVAFGEPPEAIDESRLARAIRLAQLEEVVATLPQGLSTRLGERGASLSGGQRQRVAIARALYHDPDVLVFDEATAALDVQTEREVTAAIADLHGTHTLIAIAHRLSTVRGCDRLVYLRDGRVAGIGTYDELLADPSFRALT